MTTSRTRVPEHTFAAELENGQTEWGGGLGTGQTQPMSEKRVIADRGGGGRIPRKPFPGPRGRKEIPQGKKKRHVNVQKFSGNEATTKYGRLRWGKNLGEREGLGNKPTWGLTKKRG